MLADYALRAWILDPSTTLENNLLLSSGRAWGFDFCAIL
jgi:hypothetical protein